MKKNWILVLMFFAAALFPCTGMAATWDILYSFDATSSSQAGIETNGTHIYTANWQGTSPAFYEYNMDGSFDHSFDIAGVPGIRDMAYDGIYFYGSSATMTIYVMDLEDESLIGTITVNCTGISGVRHIAYDPELDTGNGGFWIGNWAELGAIDMNGNQIFANVSPAAVNLYGSAYDDSSSGGPYLWLFSQTSGVSGAVLHQFEIATRTFTGTTHDCSDIPGYAGIAGGAATYIADDKLILLVDIQQDPNLIAAYELAPTQSGPTLTVIYDGNGATSGTVPVDGNSPYSSGATVTVLGNTGNLVRDGYVFGDWNTAADGTGTDYTAGSTFAMPAENVVLYAQWTVNTYTVTYDGNGADSGTPPADQTKTHDVPLTLATNTGSLTRTGYTFSGWNTANDGSGTHYDEGASYTDNAALTLYAEWTAAIPAAIPTLSEWGMIIFALLMAVTAIVFMRRRKDMPA